MPWFKKRGLKRGPRKPVSTEDPSYIGLFHAKLYIEGQTSSLWCDGEDCKGVVASAQVSSSSSEHGSELRDCDKTPNSSETGIEPRSYSWNASILTLYRKGQHAIGLVVHKKLPYVNFAGNGLRGNPVADLSFKPCR
ncbi:hypothetical protein AVEN_39582-1 [Araneus ventricosus]|uniref:Uncharacterized protein n=1 Tax=Araneus ventricosus TaxID=182803 RepID=A0A4Y2HKZ6_ARAVE|nr:hypothetical protein AVEN_39582-1 [Araneus ventricosus]